MAEVEEEAPAKGGLIKIILMVVVVLLIAVGSALGALSLRAFLMRKRRTRLKKPLLNWKPR